MFMSSLVKWLATNTLTAILWVFILSIDFEGRTLFSYAHEHVIESEYVQKADQGLEDLWTKVYKTARVTFSRLSGQPEKKTST